MKIRRPKFFAFITFFSLCFCLAFIVLWINSRHITVPAVPSTYNVQIQLARKLPAVKFANAALKDVIDFLRDVSGSDIQVDWAALEASGISRDTPISINSTNISLGDLLAKSLAAAGPGPEMSADGQGVRTTMKGQPWRLPPPKPKVPDPVNDPIYAFELRKRGNIPPPPPPVPVSERIIGARRYTLVSDQGMLRLWIMPRDPAAVYNQGPVGNETDPLRTRIIEFLGFSIRRGGSPLNTWAVAIPYWLLIALTGVVPTTIWLRKALRWRRRLRLGRCLRCGYDMRATPQACPECGLVGSRFANL